jgi:hypothetical protein
MLRLCFKAATAADGCEVYPQLANQFAHRRQIGAEVFRPAIYRRFQSVHGAYPGTVVDVIS